MIKLYEVFPLLFRVKSLINENKMIKMHMKLIVVDNEEVYLGSGNLTKLAFKKNYELL